MGRSAEGSDNPALAAQHRGRESSGISTPLSRSIQVLRGVGPGLDPGAGLSSQKPAGSGAQELCQEPCAPTMCLGCRIGTAGDKHWLEWSFPLQGRVPQARHTSHRCRYLFWAKKKKKNVTGSGWDFFFPATHKEPANHHERHRSIRWSPGCPDPWLALETPPQHGVPPPTLGRGTAVVFRGLTLVLGPFC